MTVQITAKVYMMFVDREARSVVSFDVSQSIYAYLQSEAVAVMNTTLDEPVMQFAVRWIYTDDSDRIVIAAYLKVTPSFTLNSLTFLSSTVSSRFDISSYQSSLNVYDVTITSQPGLTNVTGLYQISASLSFNEQVYTYTVPFSIRYDIIVPPASGNISFATHVHLTGENTHVTKSSFSKNDNVYVSTVLAPESPQFTSSQTLQVKTAFVCCLKNNTVTKFDPSNGQFGCTVYNSNTMDKWIPLINNRVAGPLTTLLPTGNSTSTRFMFSVEALSDKNRVCSVHVTSFIDLFTRSIRSPSTRNDAEESHSVVSFQIQQVTNSATSHHHKQSSIVFAIVIILAASVMMI